MECERDESLFMSVYPTVRFLQPWSMIRSHSPTLCTTCMDRSRTYTPRSGCSFSLNTHSIESWSPCTSVYSYVWSVVSYFHLLLGLFSQKISDFLFVDFQVRGPYKEFCVLCTLERKSSVLRSLNEYSSNYRNYIRSVFEKCSMFTKSAFLWTNIQ